MNSQKELNFVSLFTFHHEVASNCMHLTPSSMQAFLHFRYGRHSNHFKAKEKKAYSSQEKSIDMQFKIRLFIAIQKEFNLSIHVGQRNLFMNSNPQKRFTSAYQIWMRLERSDGS